MTPGRRVRPRPKAICHSRPSARSMRRSSSAPALILGSPTGSSAAGRRSRRRVRSDRRLTCSRKVLKLWLLAWPQARGQRTVGSRDRSFRGQNRIQDRVGAVAQIPSSLRGGSADDGAYAQSDGAAAGQGASGTVATLLRPSVTPAVRARVLPTQQLLLPKGAFIDCTLETAIDSSLPGLTTCVTATDTFGADGRVVLLERGTKLVGETRGEVRQGTARVFVLWTEARTPSGVVVPLASPGTDELGRSGLPGVVDRHFMDRFGAAILISMIDGAIQAASQSSNRGGTVIYNPSNATDVVTEVLKSTVNIPPTVRKQNGDRIQILVARDLDFRSVYELRATANAQ